MFAPIIACDMHVINYTFQQSASTRATGVCVLMHGLFSDRNESGRYERLSVLLNNIGLDTICFDFRGHGQSKWDSEQFSISGAINDLSAVLSSALDHGYTHIHLIASSFSACVAILYSSLPQKILLAKVVLLNPVIDLQASVLMAKKNNGTMIFDAKMLDTIAKYGVAQLASGFSVSSKFFHEICFVKPYEFIDSLAIPVLVFHGTLDEKVNHSISITHFSQRQNCRLILVKGATHAFKSESAERSVFNDLINWISDPV